MSLEGRIFRLEKARPKPLPAMRFLEPRSPFSWLPQGCQKLTEKQSTIFLNPARFRVVVAGRRSGKSYLSVAEMIRAARSGFRQLVWAIYPSYRMAKATTWEPLKSAIPPRCIAKVNETDLSITLTGTGSTIALRSADNPDSLRGVGLDFVVLDEYSSMDPVTWSEVIRPALADRQGQAIIQGSPRGYNHLFDLFTQAQESESWSAFKFSTAEGGLVTPEEIELVKATLDPRTYAQEFEADFAQSTNRVFLMFERANIRADLVDLGADLPPLASDLRSDPVAREDYVRRKGELLVGIDFNISPMSAVIGVKVADELHVLDELSLFNSHTAEMAEVIKQRHPGRKIITFPDPTGNARKTSAGGHTDFTILRQAGLTVISPSGSYAVVDRVNTTNALLCNTQGRRRLFIHPRCKNLIRGLEQLPYREGTNLPDKSLGIEHHCDALGYLVMREFPLLHGRASAEIRGI